MKSQKLPIRCFNRVRIFSIDMPGSLSWSISYALAYWCDFIRIFGVRVRDHVRVHSLDSVWILQKILRKMIPDSVQTYIWIGSGPDEKQILVWTESGQNTWINYEISPDSVQTIVWYQIVIWTRIIQMSGQSLD